MDILATKIYKREGRRLSAVQGQAVYNLGCGSQQYDGVIGVDRVSEADIVWDLDVVPWPIADNSADIVTAFHVFEHLKSLDEAMVEVHRILKPGGRLIVEVPYFRSVGAFQDPTHVRFFTGGTMGYFYSNHKRETARYSNVRYVLIGRWYGWPASSVNPFTRVLKRLANTFSGAYDQFISLLFPVKIIVWELEAVK